MSQFALALLDPSADPAAAVAFLRDSAGLRRDEALGFQRRNPGFLGRSLDAAAAERLRTAAAAAGLRTALLAETSLLPPPEPLKAAKIDPKPTGFYIQAGGAITFVRNEDVSLIAAWAWDAPLPPPSQEALEASIFEGIRRMAGLPGYEPRQEPPKETFFRADIIVASAEGPIRLLLAPESLDFSPLGPKREHSSLLNFRLLLDAIAAPAFNAARNGALNAFLAGRPLAPHKTAGPEACDAGLSLLMLLTKEKAGL